MKILRFKSQSGLFFGGKIGLCLVLVMTLFIGQNKTQAQTYSELDASSQEALKVAFETELDRIKDELHNPPQGIDLASHRNVLQYYRMSMQFFRKGGEVSLRDAFVKNLILLQKSPVEGHPVAVAVFTGDIDTRFLYLSSIPYETMDDVHALQAPVGENAGQKPAPVTSEFEQILSNLVIDGSNLSPLEQLFEFIRSKK